MYNPVYEQVFQHLKNNHTVVTPNNRLAKILQEEYFNYSAQAALEKPACFSYETFLQELYFKLSHHSPKASHPVLLNKQQAYFLWAEQLRSQHHLTDPGLIQKAHEAWVRCQLWLLDTQHPLFSIHQATEQFQIWSQAYNQYLQARSLITSEQLVPYLLSQKIPQLPQQIIWFCFDEYTPQQTMLQKDLTQQGILNHSLDLSPIAPQVSLLAGNDEAHELNALVHFLKQQINIPNQRVAVVVPDLTQKANTLNRVLQTHFQEDEFNLSFGKNLADYALVAHALSWINLNLATLSQEQAIILLGSPFLSGSKAEFLARAEFLQKNHLLQERVIKQHQFIHQLQAESPILASALAALAKYPKQQTTHHWASLFQERLAGLGFPGDMALDSVNYQCYQRFLLLFDDFKQLNILKPMMSANEALRAFYELAQTTIFQAEKQTLARIHVLGLLEAAGCPFDAIWISGLTDDCLPQKTQFHPLIPIALQREYGFPYSSDEKEFELATKTLSRFQAASPMIVLSYSQHIGDEANRPSPLLADLPLFSWSEISAHAPTCLNQCIREIADYRLRLSDDEIQAGSTALLSHQAQCPFKAFASHRLHLKKREEPSDGPSARERGTLIHRIMELFWRQVKNQTTLLRLDEASVAVLIDEAIQEAILPLKRDRTYSFPSFIQAIEQNRLKKLVAALLDWERARPPFQVVSLEEKHAYELSGIQFNLRTDRLDVLDDGSKWIIDYKTNLPQKTPWKEDRPSEPQILLYALLDEQIDTLLFIQLKNGQVQTKGLSEEEQDLPGIKQISTQETWHGLKSQWRQQLVELATEFSQGSCDPKPLHPGVCARCDFSDLCRFPFKN